MEELGNKITEYRKKLNLTQKDLGDKLNVSPQAVSKWENGQAEPDASTIIKLCSIFEISTDELLGVEQPEAESASNENATNEGETAITATATAEARTVAEAPAVGAAPAAPTAPAAPATIEATAAPTAPAAEPQILPKNTYNAKAHAEYKKQVTFNILSVIVGALAGVAVFLLLWFSLQVDTSTIVETEPFTMEQVIAISVVGAVGYFAFIMQVFWGGTVIDVFFFFLKSFKLPGVIFTLDLDGVIFLILFKIVGAILCALLTLLLLILGLTLMPVISLVILPFAAVKRALETAKLKKEAAK